MTRRRRLGDVVGYLVFLHTPRVWGVFGRMRRGLLTVLLSCGLSGCAGMYAVTGDAMFRPADDARPAVRGPVVPEPEPQDAELEAGVEAAAQPAPAAPPSPSPTPVTKERKKKKAATLAAVDIE